MNMNLMLKNLLLKLQPGLLVADHIEAMLGSLIET
jgi:hypothetical protein